MVAGGALRLPQRAKRLRGFLASRTAAAGRGGLGAAGGGWRPPQLRSDVESEERLGLFRCDVLLKREGAFDVLKLSALREPKVPSQGLLWVHQRR